PSSTGGETLAVLGNIVWIEKSDVSALREGVVKQMEHQVGDEVAKDKTIGTLHDEVARLTVAKAKLTYNNLGSVEKAKAQRQLALSQLARLQRLNERGKGYVSKEEI